MGELPPAAGLVGALPLPLREFSHQPCQPPGRSGVARHEKTTRVDGVAAPVMLLSLTGVQCVPPAEVQQARSSPGWGDELVGPGDPVSSELGPHLRLVPAAPQLGVNTFPACAPEPRRGWARGKPKQGWGEVGWGAHL